MARLGIRKAPYNHPVSQPVPLSRVGKKFNPGNYYLPRDLGGGVSTSELDVAVDNDEFVGAQVRYTWKSLEPTKNNYNFSAITTHLNYMAAAGKQLLIQINHKTYSDSHWTPDYIRSDAEYDGGVVEQTAGGGSGYFAMLWDAEVQARYEALISALATSFDSNPNFEGVVYLSESIIGIWDSCQSPPGGYTATKYVNSMNAITTTAAASFTESNLINYLNFFDCNSSKMHVATIHAIDEGTGIGGPDILPYDPNLPTGAYLNYKKIGNKCVKGTACQWADYDHLTDQGKKITTDEILLYGKDEMGLNYIMWEHHDSEIDDQVLPTLRKYSWMFP